MSGNSSENYIVGLFFFYNVVLIAPEAEDGSKSERACDRLIMCIITTLNQGLRNGGGIGDVLRKPSSAVSVMNVYL